MRMPEMMDSYTFANYWNTASTNAHQGVVFDEETMGRIIAFQKGEITTQGVSDPNNPNRYQMYEKANNNIHWLKEHFKSGAFAQEHNLSVNGGSQKKFNSIYLPTIWDKKDCSDMEVMTIKDIHLLLK